MTAADLATASCNRAAVRAEAHNFGTGGESFVCGWLTGELESAYEALMRCKDPKAKAFLEAVRLRNAACTTPSHQ